MALGVRGKKILLTQGDITDMDVDAVVNPANAQLVLGSGVAGAIRQKGGPTIQAECNTIGGTFVGGAVITNSGNLPAKYVIHAVGPRADDPDGDEKLRDATTNSLKLMDENGLVTIAFPAISTGNFGFSIQKCASIMLATTYAYLSGETCVQEVTFVLWTPSDYDVFAQELAKYE